MDLPLTCAFGTMLVIYYSWGEGEKIVPHYFLYFVVQMRKQASDGHKRSNIYLGEVGRGVILYSPPGQLCLFNSLIAG